MADVILTRVDVLISLEDSRMVRDAVRTLRDKIDGTLPADRPKKAVHVAGSVLPQDDVTRHYAHFHIDTVGKKGEARSILAHITHVPKPTTAPAPRWLQKQRRDGATSEWLHQTLARVGRDSPAVVRVELTSSHPRAHTRTLMPSEIPYRDGALRMAGARFVGSAGSPVSSFRFEEREAGGVKVWLEYPVRYDGNDPWMTEESRCAQLVEALL